jgi:hypothetical protein
MTADRAFARARLAELPPCLDGPNGQGTARVLGSCQDDEQELLTHSILLRYPPRTPPDALGRLGASSGIERYAGEVDGLPLPPSGYHGRLLARWDTWTKAGSAQGIVDSLTAYGITDVMVYQDFEGAPVPGAWYSRFYVVLGPVLPWDPMILGTWVLGESGTLGSSATVAEIRAVKLQVLKWKAAHAYPVRIILDFGAVAASSIDAVIYEASGFGPTVGDSAFWHIGKLFGTDTNMPFTLGGYEV